MVAKLVKAIATYRLEHGATVGLLEYLLGSRSLASAFMAPVKFRTLNIFVPILILMWAFSPAGGQSALRIVTVVPQYTNVTQQYPYLDTLKSQFVIEGSPMSSTGSQYYTGVKAAFNAALISPSTSKNGTQDTFGNINIPMLEAIAEDIQPDANGWFNTSAKENMTYTSIFGLPALNIANKANSTFSMETSYFNVQCNMKSKGFNATTGNVTGTMALNGGTDSIFKAIRDHDEFSINYDNGQYLNLWYSDTHTNDEYPLFLGLNSFAALSTPQISQAMCSLTTTYLEASVFCNGTLSCNVAAIRESKLPHPSSNLSALDGITAPGGMAEQIPGASVKDAFLQSLINATSVNHESTSSPMEYFFINPAFPFSAGIGDTASTWPYLYKVSSELFSRRLTQLLNTFWLAGIAPSGVTGDFTNPSNDKYIVATATGTKQTLQLVLRCHVPYLVVLVLAASVVFIAGLVTAYLDALRSGPDVLDNFVNTLRDSPHVHVDFGPSMEDGTDKIKRLRNTMVKMGDVKPDDPVGLVAIATPTPQRPVLMVKPGREYV